MKVSFNLDIDKQEYASYMEMVKFLERVKRLKEGSWRFSSSGTGMHIKVSYNVPNFFEEALDMKSFVLGMRYALGDCLGRHKSDVTRIQLGEEEIDILFERKNGKDAGEWKVFK